MRKKDHKALTPKGLLNSISRKFPRFGNGSQQDSHEVLINLLDVMDTEATKKKKRSIVDKVFGGTFCNSVLCLSCKNVSRTVQRFTDIILDINFQKGGEGRNYQQNYHFNNYHSGKRMSKRERKRMRNKKNKWNKKQNKYFKNSWKDQGRNNNYNNNNQEGKSKKKDKTLLEYLVPEELLEEEAVSLDPKIYFKIDQEQTILEEYGEEGNEEAEGEGQKDSEESDEENNKEENEQEDKDNNDSNDSSEPELLEKLSENPQEDKIPKEELKYIIYFKFLGTSIMTITIFQNFLKKILEKKQIPIMKTKTQIKK